MKRWCNLLTMVLFVLLSCTALAESEFRLPYELKTIEAEAFWGDISLTDKDIILPEGLERIESRAFANTGIGHVSLPASLKYIASDAFEGIPGSSLSAEPGTYAYQWLTDNHFSFYFRVEASWLDCYTVTWPSLTKGADYYRIRVFCDEDCTEEYTSIECKSSRIAYVNTDVGIRYWFVMEYAQNNRVYEFGPVTVDPLPPLPAPENLTATVDTDGFVHLSWNAVPDAIGYRVYISKKPEWTVDTDWYSFVGEPADCEGASDYREVQLERNDTVYFWVCADNGNGPNCRTSVMATRSEEWISSPVDDFTFNSLDDMTCEVTGYTGSDTEIAIPDKDSEGRSVIRIGQRAFENQPDLTKIVIPDGVTSIADLAFYGCGAKSINIPDGVTSIGRYAFHYCNMSSISIPDSVSSIGQCAFEDCQWLESITIPEGITNIDDFTFHGCYNLKMVSIPDSVTRIGWHAFSNCQNIKTFVIPNSVTNIDKYAFYDCVSLQTINLPDGITEIGIGTFQGCRELRTIDIPESVTSIGNYAFSGCSRLTSVYLPDSITAIGGEVFAYCTNLESITYPRNWSTKTYPSLGSPFQYCTKLKSIVIPEGVTVIPDYAFYGASSLRMVSLPSTLVSIGSYAFSKCSALTDISIWDHVESIGDSAFSDRNSALTFHGIAGSYAEVYADENGIQFETDAMHEEISDSNAIFTVYVFSPIQTKMSGALIQVTAVSNNVVLCETVTNSQGIATIEGLKKNCMYRFTCNDNFFTYLPIYRSASGENTQISFVAQNEKSDYLIASPEGQQIDQSGGSAEIQITSTSTWFAQSNANWLSIEPSCGKPGDVITVTASSNDGIFRTGEILIGMGAQTVSAVIRQPGALGSRLGTPTITFPASDNDEVEYGNITVTWEAVEGAESYVVSLRDLDTDTLLINHESTSSATEVTLSTYYFSDGARYRVAVGAVPAGTSSTDPAVGWCERLFTIPEFHDTSDVIFTGTVYELYSAEEVNAAKSILKSRGLLSKDALLTATKTDTLSAKAKSDTTVSIYHLNTTDNTWEFVKSDRTNNYGTYSIGGLTTGEKYSLTFEYDNYDFMTNMEMITYTAQPGKNQIVDVYCYNPGVAEQIEALRNLQGYDVTGKDHGLFAEYFAWEGSNKNNIFTAGNKRNEGYISNVDLSWSNETTTSGFLVTNTRYRLNSYTFESAGKGNVLQQINYVPFKFGARFNGYLKLKGAADAEAMANYKFRLRGDDGVRLKMHLPSIYETYEIDDWSNGLSNAAVVDLSKYSFFNGTVFGVTIEYYNKSDGGKANLILEYSTDKGKSWATVPHDWLYVGERTVTILDSGVTTGVNYVTQLANSNKTLATYGDKLIADMLTECADKAVGSALSLYHMNTFIFSSKPSSNGKKIANFIEEKIGKKVAKAFYKAVFNQVCDLNDEEKIWKAIGNELKKQFQAVNFDTVYDGTDSAIDGIGLVQQYLALMHENTNSNSYLEGIEKSVLQAYKDTVNDTFGNFRYNDNRPEIYEGQWETFFELSGRNREDMTADILKLDEDVSTAWSFAKDGMALLERLFGDDAEINRAMLSLMFAEQGTAPDLFEASLKMSGNADTSVYDRFYNIDGTRRQIPNREVFESKLNELSNSSIINLTARIQGVSMEELLYKDLLKMVLDTTVSYYKGLLE